jgi:hypothetical protein
MTFKTDSPQRFRLATGPLLISAAIISSPGLAFFLCVRGHSLLVLAATTLQTVLLFIMALLISQVAVTTDGVTLNHVNVLPWDQVERVSPSRVLGLRYLKAYRKGRRWAWWFPLYLADPHGFRRAVIEQAPHGNPFRTFLEGEATTTS